MRNEKYLFVMDTAIIWLKYLILIISSLWFWPVSCTTASIVGIQRLTERSVHHFQIGEAIPHKFSVVVFPNLAEPSFTRITYANIASYPASAFHAAVASGFQSRGGEDSESYTVQAQSRTFQTIEVMKEGDTQTLWSTYQLSASGITPISSREFNIGAAIVIPFAVAIATLICALARWLRRRFVETEVEY